MAKKPEPSHIPERMCAICRRRFPKRLLARYVFTEQGQPQADERKIMPGRGVYCCADAACIEKFKRYRPRVRKRSRGEL